MPTTIISSKYQIVIPKEIRKKLRLSPRQRLQIFEKGGVISLVPDVPLKSLKGFVKRIDQGGLREKQERA
jgi:AbrB family looped-hinge helix DNA binding protein